MCIIAYKPAGKEFPSKRTLHECFNNNPDGAGFMVADGETVHIRKGYMGFRSFWKSLRAAREKYGDDKAYVMHFRISTQGGVREDCTHPFPLSDKMDDMRELSVRSDIGVAHNGVISLCSTYGYGGKSAVTYSDTMSFITDYLSLIIQDIKYYTDWRNLKLIEKLCGSRLAILDKFGHCEIIGSGWVVEDGIHYSNTSYKESRIKTNYVYKSAKTSSKTSTSYKGVLDTDDDAWWDDYRDTMLYYEKYYDEKAELYDFRETDCPAVACGDCSYCEMCKQMSYCWDGYKFA